MDINAAYLELQREMEGLPYRKPGMTTARKFKELKARRPELYTELFGQKGENASASFSEKKKAAQNTAFPGMTATQHISYLMETKKRAVSECLLKGYIPTCQSGEPANRQGVPQELGWDATSEESASVS